VAHEKLEEAGDKLVERNKMKQEGESKASTIIALREDRG